MFSFVIEDNTRILIWAFTKKQNKREKLEFKKVINSMHGQKTFQCEFLIEKLEKNSTFLYEI